MKGTSVWRTIFFIFEQEDRAFQLAWQDFTRTQGRCQANVTIEQLASLVKADLAMIWISSPNLVMRLANETELHKHTFMPIAHTLLSLKVANSITKHIFFQV